MAYRNERGDERFLGGNTTETAAELFERGDFKRALVYALRVIKVYPLDPLPYVIAGDAMQRLGSRDMEEVVGIEGDFLKEEDSPEAYYQGPRCRGPFGWLSNSPTGGSPTRPLPVSTQPFPRRSSRRWERGSRRWRWC